MLKFIKSGLWTTLQDQGRFGYRHLGVPVSGVMDERSANLANLLLNNSPSSALLEITLTGPELEFQKSTQIALTGADISPMINQVAIPLNTAVNVNEGDNLSFGRLKYGVRSYLAISKGFMVGNELKSQSFYKPITQRDRFDKGELLDYSFSGSMINAHAPVKVDPQYFQEQLMEVSPGPEFYMLNDEQKEKLRESTFTIAKNNRMAYQLDELVPNQLKSILTSAVIPGTVQMTSAGKLIVLMRDCQTTGGYPRILQLSETAICQLSQKQQGDFIQFKLTN